MDDDIVRRAAVIVGALHGAIARVPYLYRAVLAARHEPLALAVKGHAGNVARVPLQRLQRLRVGQRGIV